ncbi:MAG: acetyl-CoA carboxylase biotin carboxyl carrier protein [Blastocatellales bacterium]
MKKTERKTRRTPSKEATAPKVEAQKKPTSTTPSEDIGLSEIKQLIELIFEKQFNEFELERGNFRLRLLKGVGKTASGQMPIEMIPRTEPVIASAPVTQTVVEPQQVAPVANTSSPVAQEEENLHIITSPIVGTFYRSPSPTADVFVKIGDTIENGKVLCIIEAMKLMNEIQSDTSGVVAKIFVENGQPVEFGQALFGIKQ